MAAQSSVRKVCTSRLRLCSRHSALQPSWVQAAVSDLQVLTIRSRTWDDFDFEGKPACGSAVEVCGPCRPDSRSRPSAE